jgi:hypothetical protein
MSTSIRRATGRPRPPWKAVAAASLAAFAVIFGAESLRLHHGNDPALQQSTSSQSSASTAQSTQDTQQAFSDDGGSLGGFDSSSLPTTRSS